MVLVEEMMAAVVGSMMKMVVTALGRVVVVFGHDCCGAGVGAGRGGYGGDGCDGCDGGGGGGGHGGVVIAVTVELVEMEVEGEVVREGLVQMVSSVFPELLFSVL